MKKIKLYSPDGKVEKEVYPHQAGQMIACGWSEKTKIKPKKVKEDGNI